MSTSLQRTYRNLRVAIAGTVVLLGISVVVASFDVGALPSISAYYYTSARNVFVGTLIAVAIAIIALSGRGLQRALLDAAALFAPLIALVPTPIRDRTVPGYADACGRAASCVPADALADINTGVATYLIAGALTVAVVVIATLVSGGGAFTRTLPSLAIACAVLLLVALSWHYFRDTFVETAHLIAAVAFFALIAVVAVTNAFDTAPGSMPSSWRRTVYWIIAIAMTVDIIALVAVVIRENATRGSASPVLGSASPVLGSASPVLGSASPVLIGEAIALLLFAAFWVVQSAEKWSDADPSIVARDEPNPRDSGATAQSP